MIPAEIPAIDWANTISYRFSGPVAAYTPKVQTSQEYPGPQFRHPRYGPTYIQDGNEIIWHLRWPGYNPFTGEPFEKSYPALICTGIGDLYGPHVFEGIQNAGELISMSNMPPTASEFFPLTPDKRRMATILDVTPSMWATASDIAKNLWNTLRVPVMGGVGQQNVIAITIGRYTE